MYHAYLSFNEDDKKVAELFVSLCNKLEMPIEFRMSTEKSEFNDDYKTKAKQKIFYSSFTVCLIGKSTYNDEIVEWEIKTSRDNQKQILAISVIGGEPLLPFTITELNITPIPLVMEQIRTEVLKLMGENDGE